MGAYCYFKFMEDDLPFSMRDAKMWFDHANIYWHIFKGTLLTLDEV